MLILILNYGPDLKTSIPYKNSTLESQRLNDVIVYELQIFVILRGHHKLICEFAGEKY